MSENAAASNAPAAAAVPSVPAAPAAPEVKAPAAAAPVVPEVKAPEVSAVEQGDPVVTAFGGRTGDAGLDVALKFLAGHGYTSGSDAIKVAVETGDLSLLRAELAAKQVPGAAEYLAMAEQGLQRQAQAQEAADAAILTTLHEEVGGEEQWNQIRDWSRANFAPEHHDSINAALTQGGIVAAAMAQFLRNTMAEAGEVEPRNPVKADNRQAAAPSSNGTLTFPEYQAEVRKLAAAKRGQIDGTPEYAALQRRLRR